MEALYCLHGDFSQGGADIPDRQMWDFHFLKKRRGKKNHIVCRHQKNDANVGKGLSVVGLRNVWQQVLHIISISGALLPFLAPVGEEPNKTVSIGRHDYQSFFI